MNLSKIIIVVIALGAAIGAMMLSKSFTTTPAQVTIVAEVKNAQILLASQTLLMGHKIEDGDIVWRIWPENMIQDTMIVKSDNAEAMEKLVNTIVLVQIDQGDPIRMAKLIDPKGGGRLSAILPSGMRAISTPISPETGAGGFILPNDKVDVLLTAQDGSKNTTKTILINIRVLAIDQTIKQGSEEGDGDVVVGKTATLELNPEQTEILAMANNIGTLTLSLRSIADRDTDVQFLNKKTNLVIIRHGKS